MSDELIVPAPGNPMAVARMFFADYYAGADGEALLRHHRGDFYAWSGTCWLPAEEDRIKADLYRWLEPAVYLKPVKDDVELAPFEPTRYKIANVVEAFEAVGHLDASVEAPAWINGQGSSGSGEPIIAHEFVPMANGLLHLPSRELRPHTPAFFSHYSLPFDFDPKAPRPRRWRRFLRELWEDDDESTSTLGEIFGYVLGGDTGQQKLFMTVGPKRSGKGTIGRVLTGLLGIHHTAAPTLAGLTTNFGLQPLIGKPLAVISDARLGTRVDGMVAVERLLSISGEDSLTIDRKYLAPWTGRLPTRFMILTNELPRFTDSSGALASRFVLLVLRTSFYGKEDPTLTDQLLAEAPGIFNWALQGLDRLQERGYFVQPESAREALRHLEDLSSPVGAFVRDCCEVGPTLRVDKDVLYTVWRHWCQLEGQEKPGSKAVFTRDLRAAVPGVMPRRLREGNKRRHVFQGIQVSPQWKPPLTTPDQGGSSAGGQGWSGVSSIADSHRGR